MRLGLGIEFIRDEGLGGRIIGLTSPGSGGTGFEDAFRIRVLE